MIILKTVLTVTFHRANNYGAMLQAYALQKILERKYNTSILDYYCDAVFDGYKLISFKNGKKVIKSLFKLPFYYSRYKKFAKFRKKLSLTEHYKNIMKLKKFPPAADAYIVGSDQVWNPNITNGLDDVYFLNFGSNKTKRIAYAASCGNYNYILEMEQTFKSKIECFDAISVREKKLLLPIKKVSGKDVNNVLDPVLLLEKNDWLNLIGKRKLMKEKYIFAYSVGNATELYYDVVNELAKNYGYLIVFFDRRDKEHNFKYSSKSLYNSGPLEFVNLLYNADLVVTTSFHCLALSILFNKRFGAVMSTYPDRLISLLEEFNLNKRIISSISDVGNFFENEIDWDSVNILLNEKSKESINWLYNNIG